MMRLRLIASAVAASSALALVPAGFTTWFAEPCPAGWAEIPEAVGRLVVSVTDPSVAGLTVGVPLSAEEDVTHVHAYIGNITLPSKHVAADSCCDTVGASSGVSNPFAGTTEPAESGLPFLQFYLCRLEADDASLSVPFGAVAYWDPSIEACPANWSSYTMAAGRSIVGGYISTGGAPFPSFDAPLGSQEDRAHSHNFATTLVVPDVDYVGVDGCCNDAPAPAGTYPLYGSTEPASAGVPYIQLLTCFSEVDGFNATLPAGAMLFSPLIGCDTLAGWTLAEAAAGRFLVALPDGGVPGASWGGDALAPNATAEVGTSHSLSGSVTLSGDDIGLAEGCCATGYAAQGTVQWNAVTGAESPHFPYLMAALCQQARRL